MGNSKEFILNLATREKFAAWLEATYPEGMHDDRLCDLMQDGDMACEYLESVGLDIETEIV
jgi:hypothetical protein